MLKRNTLRILLIIVLILVYCFSISYAAQTDLENDLAKAEERKSEGESLEGDNWGVQSFNIEKSYVDEESNTAVIEFTATLKQWYYNYGGELKTPLMHIYRDGTAIASYSTVPAVEEILEQKEDNDGNVAYIIKLEYRFTDTHEPGESFSYVYSVAFNGTSQFGTREYIIVKQDVELSSSDGRQTPGNTTGTTCTDDTLDAIEIPVNINGIKYENEIKAEDALFDGHIIKNITGQGIKNNDDDELNYDQVVSEFYKDKNQEEIKKALKREEVNDEVATPLRLEGEVYIRKFGTDKRVRLTSENMKKVTLRPGDKIFTGKDSNISFIPNDSGGLHTVGSKATFTFAGLTTFQKVKARNEAREWDEFKKSYLGFLDEGTIQCITSHADTAKNAAKSITKMFTKNKEDNYNVVCGSRSSFIMTVDSGSVNVKLVEGEVDMSILETNQSVSLVSGQESTAGAGKSLSTPQSFDIDKSMENFAQNSRSGMLVPDKEQKLKVVEGGMVLIFSPDRDGSYRFFQQVEQENVNDNIQSHLSPVHMELLDKKYNVIFHNKGSKGDIYSDSYNKGDDVIIGQGGNPDDADSVYYYDGFSYDCRAGEDYYVRLDIPEEDCLSESDRELYGEDFKVSRNITALITYEGEPKANKKGQDEGEGGNILTRFLLIFVVILVLFLIIKNIGKKKNPYGQDQKTEHPQTNPQQGTQVDSSTTQQARFCSQCGYKLKPGTKFCPNCGNKIE